MKNILRRRPSFLLIRLLALACFAAGAPSQAATELRIGYQKAASTLVLLRAHGALEKRLAPLGVTVKWLEFTAGPQLLEGLNFGSIDFGYVGEVPPIFALAAHARFVYIAYELPTPHAEGLLVAKDSPIHAIADLKGKRIAFNKGSDVHWLVVAALRGVGLRYSDVQPVYLSPADARAAFQQGAVDAWAIWDPFFVAAQQQLGARVLTDAAGVVQRYQYFLSTRDFAEHHKDAVDAVMDEAGKEGQRIRQDYGAAAAELAPIQGLPAGIIEAGLRHYEHVYKPVDDGVLTDQQQIADAFYELKLIPGKVSVRDATLPR